MYIVEEHMRRRRLIKRISIVSAIILVICIAAGFVIHWYISQPDIKSRSFSDSYEDILYMESGASGTNTLAVVTHPEITYLKDRIFPGDLVWTVDAEYLWNNDEGEAEQIDKMICEAYDITSGKKIGTIDLKKVVEENAPGYIISDPEITHYLFWDKNYKWIYMLRSEEKWQWEKQLVINAKTWQINLYDGDYRDYKMI